MDQMTVLPFRGTSITQRNKWPETHEIQQREMRSPARRRNKPMQQYVRGNDWLESSLAKGPLLSPPG